MNTITGECYLTEGSEHNHWKVFLSAGMERNYRKNLFDRRKWTQSLYSLVCLNGVNTITANSGFPEGSDHIHWRVNLTEGSESVLWRTRFERKKWTKSEQCFTWEKLVNIIPGEICLPEGSEHSHRKFFLWRKDLNKTIAEFHLAERSEHNHWSVLLDRRNWTQ